MSKWLERKAAYDINIEEKAYRVNELVLQIKEMQYPFEVINFSDIESMDEWLKQRQQAASPIIGGI